MASSQLGCPAARPKAECWVSGVFREQNSREAKADLPRFPSRSCSSQSQLSALHFLDPNPACLVPKGRGCSQERVRFLFFELGR